MIQIVLGGRKSYATINLMAKTILITLTVIVILSVGVALCFYSAENVVPEESELVKYPEIQPFLAGRTGFRGIRHNLDTGFYSFAFPTSHNTSESFFEVVHLAAVKEGWELIGSDRLKRIYRRPSNDYPAAIHLDRVTLFYKSENSEVVFELERDYSEKKN